MSKCLNVMVSMPKKTTDDKFWRLVDQFHKYSHKMSAVAAMRQVKLELFERNLKDVMEIAERHNVEAVVMGEPEENVKPTI